jgi:hypothetical protein
MYTRDRDENPEPNVGHAMTITVDLPPELESELAAEATSLGLPLADYILRVLAAGRTAANLPKTGKELVAYWQNEGLIGTRPEITDSQQRARTIRAQSEKRSREKG